MSLHSYPHGSRSTKQEDGRQQREEFPHAGVPADPATNNLLYTNAGRGIGPYDPLPNPVDFAPRPAWEPYPGDPHHHRHAAYQHQRPMHHPYASYDNRHVAESDSRYVSQSHQPSPSLLSSFAPPSSPGTAQGSPTGLVDIQQRQVSRSACLSCRSAKRKCDGFKPICGPCSLRGVKEGVHHEDGGCVFVASKRGGPRFKGVKGSEATKKKLDERDKVGRIKDARSASGNYDAEDGMTVSSSDHDTQPGNHGQHPTPGSSASDLPSFRGHRPEPESVSPRTPDTPHNLQYGRNPIEVLAAAGHFVEVNAPVRAAREFPFEQGRNCGSVAGVHGTARGGLFDDLPDTSAFHKLPDLQSGFNQSMASFYQKLEDLPKAGAITMLGADELTDFDIDMPQALLDIQTATKTSVAVNSEQQSRALLSDYYELVYPACPVMLPSGHLSSLAFHLSEDDSSALLSAISACVALHLPQAEVRRIVKGSLFFHDPDDHETKAELLDLEHASRQEIAAYLAKSAEKLLLKKVALLATASSFTVDSAKSTDTQRFSSNANQGGPDLELVRIKLVATHTLLSHYHYGTCNARRAFHYATQAWNHAQALDLDAGDSIVSKPSWFTQEQKCEWARRTYWVCYTAATVMSCTGGFKPLSVTRDMPSDLGLLPNLVGDRSSWKVLVRGAQFVSRAYASLYDLDSFKNRLELHASDAAPQAQDLRRRWETIFDRMRKVDNDVMQYARSDPIWSDESAFAPGVGLSRRVALFEEENETRLSRSLRVAGKLMSSGALIILHRAQAFANAKIFVAPTCGIPGACEEMSDTASDHGMRRRASDRLWHREATSSKVPLGADLISPVEENGSRSGDVDERDARSRSGSSMDSSGGASVSKSHLIASPSTSLPSRMALSAGGIPAMYSGGPFEPSDSLDRCRFAASVMFAQLEHINQSTFQHGRRESMAVLPVEGASRSMSIAVARELWSAPSLPPFSACSLVLAAYVLLMETLHAQIAAGSPASNEMEDDKAADEAELPAVLCADPHRSAPIVQITGPKAGQLAAKLQDCIIEIEAALDRFSRAWDVAKGYAQEVKLLLEVNQSLFATPTN